jgi:hypothetical protein
LNNGSPVAILIPSLRPTLPAPAREAAGSLSSLTPVKKKLSGSKSLFTAYPSAEL